MICVAVCLDMFMICGSGLSGYVYDMWYWFGDMFMICVVVWICLCYV